MASLKKYVNVKLAESYFYARRSFYQARRKRNESVFQWGKRVINLALKCGFSTEMGMVMRDIFVVGMGSGAIQDRLLVENATKTEVTFSYLMDIALKAEISTNDESDRIKKIGAGLQNHEKTIESGQFMQIISNMSEENGYA